MFVLTDPPPLPFGLACVLVPCSVLSSLLFHVELFHIVFCVFSIFTFLSLLLSYQGSCFPRVTFCKYSSHFLVHLSHLFSLVNMKLLLLTWHEGPYFTSIAFTKVSSSFFSTIIYTVLWYCIVFLPTLYSASLMFYYTTCTMIWKTNKLELELELAYHVHHATAGHVIL